MQRKKTVYKGLQFIDVWYTDTSLTSPDYFQISEFPTRLTAGKNLFKLLGNPTTLKVGGYLNLEILDYNGDPIYYEVVNYIDEDTSRVIAIYIYEDTPPGDCTITLTAETLNAPPEWQGRANIKWLRTVQVNPTVANDSEIIFETLPAITLSEQIGPHLDRTYATDQFPIYTTGKIKYFLLNNQPAIEISGGSFINDMTAGTITVAAPQNATPLPTYTPSTTAYTSSIKKVLSPTTALLDTAYKVYSSKTIFPHIYTNFANSSFSLKYESTPTYTTTQNSESYALIQIAGLQPATGDVSRIKTFMNNNGTVGTWELINDIELAETEIFVTDTASLFPDTSIGSFTSQNSIDVYWNANAYRGKTLVNPPPTLVWSTASIDNAMKISSALNLDAKNTVLKIYTDINGIFQENASYKITIDALGTRSGSVAPVLAIYMSGSSFYQDPTDYFNQEFRTKFGKRIGELRVTSNNQRFDDYVVNFNSDYTGTGILQLVVESGNWQVANIRTTSDNDPGYTPDYTRIKSLVPTAHKSNNQLSFKIEYYNVAGVKSKQINYSLNNNWQGGNRYIDGDYSMITGSVWVGDSLSKGLGITGGQNAGHVMSAGYQGFDSGKPGFLMWSGSVLPGKLSNFLPYSGVGLELYQNANNYFRYSTRDNILDIATQTFLLGVDPGTYIYGDSVLGLAISSSNFALDFAGNVTMSGTITATAGNIGGFTINTNALSNANNFYISGAATGNGFFISSSKFNVKANGDVTGSNVLFTGGKIGGFTISNNTLSNANNFYISGSASGNDFFISSSKFNVKANGDVTASSALFSGSVSVTGNINATTGNIGGFAITRDAITGSGFFLSGSATGNGFFISSSNFNVKASGDITGSSVLFTGGKIGSFTLTNNALSGISSGATTFLISSSVDPSNLSTAFFISSSKFNVRQDGTVSGSQVFFDGGKIGGFTIDSSKITGTNIVIDSAGSIQTSDYASDLKGWKISAMSNGYAEFENARIRGTLKTAVFEKETVNAVGGQLYVANSSTITGSEATTSIPQIAYLKFGGYSGSTAIQNIVGSTNTYLTVSSLTTASIKNLPASTQTFKPIGGTGLLIASGSKTAASIANTSVASLAGTPSTALSNYTVMAWVRPDFSSYTASKPSGSIIEKSGSASSLSGPFFLGFNVESVNTASFIYSTNNNFAVPSVVSPTIGTNALRTNTWTHVALVGSTGANFTRTPYINGASGDPNGIGLGNAPAINTSPINLGVGQTYSERFPGYIADVRVYNVAMTAGEIAAIYSGSYFTSSIAVNTPSLQIDNVTGFVNGEILSAKKINDTGFATEYFQVRDTMRLLPSSETDFSGVLYVTRSYGNGLTGDSGSLGNSPSAAQSYEPAQVIVSTGKLGTGFIRINANPNDENTPYIDIVERTGSGIYDVALKARLGDLSGLANSSYVFGKSNPGFGLATDNVFLQGGIIANTGSIGGINMASSKLFTGATGTYNNPNTGFYLDSAGQFSLKDKLAWDGTILTVSGTINATAGNIGGFAITQNAITGSGFYLSGSATGNGFFISSSKFNVKANGDVTASSALFSGSVSVTGNINATTGNIGGFAITRDAITGSGFYLSGSATGNGFFISSSNFNVKASGDITASNALFSGNVSAVNFSKKMITVTNTNSASYFQTISAGPPLNINLIFDGSGGGEKTMVMEIACSTNPSLNINDIIVSNTGSGLMPQVDVIISQTNVTFDNEIIATQPPEPVVSP